MVDLVGRKVAKQSHCCPQKYSLTPSNKLQRKSLIVHMDRVEVIRYFIEFNLYFVLVNLIVTKWYFHPTYVFGEKPIFINRRKYNL